MSELKPCPFCGKENKVAGSTERMILGWWYECEDCFENRKGGVHEDKWNTRPIEDALKARIADLEARAEKAEALVEKLIEAGRMMKQPETIEEFHRGRRDYDALVAEWKEQK